MAVLPQKKGLSRSAYLDVQVSVPDTLVNVNAPSRLQKNEQRGARSVPEPLWTTWDVANFLGVPARTVEAWRYKSKGPPGIRVGRHVRYRPEDVMRWLEQQADPP